MRSSVWNLGGAPRQAALQAAAGEERANHKVVGGFLAVLSGFGDQVGVSSAWRVDEGVRVSLGACLSVMVT